MPKRKPMISISVMILLSYLLIMLIPLCAVLVVYNMSVNTILDYQYRQTVFSLENTAATISVRLEEMSNIHSYITSNPGVNAVHNRGSNAPRRNIHQIHQALSGIPAYPLTNQLISRVVIVFGNAAYIGVPPSGFVLNKKTYNDNIHFYGISYERLLEMCESENYGIKFLANGEAEKDKEILLSGRIPGSRTLVVLQMHIPALKQILASGEAYPGGATYLLDGDGQMLAGSGEIEISESDLRELEALKSGVYKEMTYNGKVYLSYVLHYDGFSYVSLVEKEHLLAQAAPIRYIMAALIGLALALGVVVCLTMWQHRRRIVKHVELTARRAGVFTEPPKTEGQFYKTAFTNMADTLDTLRKTLDQQRDALRDTVLRNALLGTFGGEADLQSDIESTGLCFNAEWYYVVNVLLRPGETNTDTSSSLPYRTFLKQFLTGAMVTGCLACDIDGGSFVLMLPAPEMLPLEELKEKFTELSRKIEEMEWTAPSFAISGGCRELSKLHGPYEQTRAVAEYLTCLDLHGVFLISELPSPGEQICLTVDNELRFIQLMNIDSPNELETFWNTLVIKNIRQHSFSADTLVSMRERLRHCILQALTSRAGNEEADALAKSVKKVKSLNGIYQYAVQTQRVLTQATSVKINQENAEIKIVLSGAVEEHFADPAFSLSILSEISGIPENTLYRMFKSYFGVSFSAYLEQCRITEAFKLLRGHVPVKDVAVKVGYTSDHSFRRAFKRIMKIPPSQFGMEEE